MNNFEPLIIQEFKNIFSYMLPEFDKVYYCANNYDDFNRSNILDIFPIERVCQINQWLDHSFFSSLGYIIRL